MELGVAVLWLEGVGVGRVSGIAMEIFFPLLHTNLPLFFMQVYSKFFNTSFFPSLLHFAPVFGADHDVATGKRSDSASIAIKDLFINQKGNTSTDLRIGS